MAILYLLSSALQKDIMMAADNKQGKERQPGDKQLGDRQSGPPAR